MTVWTRALAVGLGLLASACGPSGWDPGGGPEGASDPDNPFLQQRGTTLVDGSGNPVQLRAVNLGGWLLWEGWIWGGGVQSGQAILEKLALLVGPEKAAEFTRRVHDGYITDADLARISALGFNAVRVPLNYRLLEDDAAPFVYQDRGWEVLDRLVDQCERHGLLAILDLHSAPGGQAPYFMADPGPTSLWVSASAQDRTVALWRAIAERYRERAGIGGYDLLNEPAPPTGAALLDLYKRIAAAVREVDRNHLIIVEGASFAGDFSPFTTPVTWNQAYSFHQYLFLGDSRQEELDRYRAISEAHQIPMWNGEFGVNSVELIASSRELYLANGLSGFGFWTWKELPQDTPYLIGITAEIPHWRKLIAWVAGGPTASRPSVAEAELGMEEFLAALPLERCEENPAMAAALTGTAPR